MMDQISHYLLLSFLLAVLSGQLIQLQAPQQGTTERQDCPTMSVDCPTSIPEKGQLLLYTVSVTQTPAGDELTYKWDVSRGKIVEGQGTSSIKVDVGEENPQGITATVEVAGLESACTNSASCTSMIGLRREGGTKRRRPHRTKD